MLRGGEPVGDVTRGTPMSGHSYQSSHQDLDLETTYDSAPEQASADIGNAARVDGMSHSEGSEEAGHDEWGTALAESASDLALEVLIGEATATQIDLVVDDYWDARCGIDPILGQIQAADATAAALIEGLVVESEGLLGDLESALADVRATATLDGEVVSIDEDALADAIHTLDLLDQHGYALTLHAERWAYVLSLPDLQLLQGLMLLAAGLVGAQLKVGEQLVGELMALQQLLADHSVELAEAEAKVGVDVGLVIGSVAIALSPLTGVAAAGAGLALMLGGIGASLYIEGGLSSFGELKSLVTGTKLLNDTTKVVEYSPGLQTGLKGLGPALNVVSLALDGMEVSEERTAIANIVARMQQIEPTVEQFLQAWPELERSLIGIASDFGRLQQGLEEWADRVDAIDAELAAMQL